MAKGRKTGGRAAGVPNKATRNMREGIAHLIEGNFDKLQGWLDEIAKDDGPKAAWSCVVELLEFSVPKLARLEHSGPDGAPISVEHGAKPELINDILSLVKPQDDPKPQKQHGEDRRRT